MKIARRRRTDGRVRIIHRVRTKLRRHILIMRCRGDRRNLVMQMRGRLGRLIRIIRSIGRVRGSIGHHQGRRHRFQSRRSLSRFAKIVICIRNHRHRRLVGRNLPVASFSTGEIVKNRRRNVRGCIDAKNVVWIMRW